MSEIEKWGHLMWQNIIKKAKSAFLISELREGMYCLCQKHLFYIKAHIFIWI